MLSRQAGNTAATFKVGMMIENIGAAMATFFVLAAVKPAYRFVCTIFDPGDLRGPLVPGLVPGLAKRFNQSSSRKRCRRPATFDHYLHQ